MLLAACGSTDSASGGGGKSIELGVVASLSGPAAPFGEQQVKGVQQAAADWNAKHANKIKLSVQDDQSDPKSGVSAMRKLIEEKPDAIVGPTASTIGVALAPIAKASKIPLMAASVSAPEFVSAGGFTFRDRSSTPQQTGATTKWAVENGVRSLGMIVPNAADGKAAAKEIASTVEGAGGSVTGTEYVDATQTEYQAQMTKLVAAKPDALFVFLIAPEAIATAMKQARQLGFKGRFLTVSNVEGDAFLKAAGHAADDAVWSVETAPDGPQADRYKAFATAFKQKNGGDPDIIAGNAYDAATLLAQGGTAVGGGSALRDWLHEQKYAGITGAIAFDDKGDIVNKQLTIRTLHGGKFVNAPGA
ncbi:ABC transporter substrate-binding protein [Baekduia alba]|uniref:ABC transporter substrate-binding protein n=1 Tax=Baekduia alba TaxID=2997333 RepID=UPI0023417F90|nr:ABC transporter substrate-binding protein [Baekduia alba]